MKRCFAVFFAVFFMACNSKVDLSIERGIHYFEAGQTNEAILEFKQAIQLMPSDHSQLSIAEIQLLSQAYHNLAVAYAKNKWFNEAESSAQTAFDLVPSAENKEVLELIQTKKN
jgi:Flp pilus assembly protein TadD